MSDISNWHELIKEETTSDDAAYITIPVSNYQMANLLGCLKRSKHLANGDWFDEWIAIISATMKIMKIDSLTNNFGDEFCCGKVYEEVYKKEENNIVSEGAKKQFLIFDFNKGLGDTIKERVEELKVFVKNAVNHSDNIFAIGSPETASLFEASCMGFYPKSQVENNEQEDNALLVDCGKQSGFRLYKSDNIPKNELYVFGDQGITIITIKGVKN